MAELKRNAILTRFFWSCTELNKVGFDPAEKKQNQ